MRYALILVCLLLLPVSANAVSYTETTFIYNVWVDDIFGGPGIQSVTQLGDDLFIVVRYPGEDVELWVLGNLADTGGTTFEGTIGGSGIRFDCCGINVYWSNEGVVATVLGGTWALCNDGCAWQGPENAPVPITPPPAYFFVAAIIGNNLHVTRFDPSQPLPIPEPSTLLLLVSGLGLLFRPLTAYQRGRRLVVRYTLIVLTCLLLTTYPIHAASLEGGNVNAISPQAFSDVEVSIYGEGLSASVRDIGVFGISSLSVKPGEILDVHLLTEYYASGTVDGIELNGFIGWPSQYGYMAGDGAFSVLIPIDAVASFIELQGLGTVQVSLQFFHDGSVKDFSYHGTGIGTLSLFRGLCVDGSLCYVPSTASISFTTAPEPATALLIASGVALFILKQRYTCMRKSPKIT